MYHLGGLTPMIALRFICGLFLIPHAVGKVTARSAAYSFFESAGFKPAARYAYTAMITEVIVAIMLMAGVFVQIAAWIACLYLLIAALAVLRVSGKWLWHLGGCEYPFFFATCAAIVGWSAST
jgi:putative oxidoreductase